MLYADVRRKRMSTEVSTLATSMSFNDVLAEPHLSAFLCASSIASFSCSSVLACMAASN